ncbi:MAG: prenyltransferase/squalene oxidase repeat-containing protein [Planctomycetaceae bacterium]
MTESETLSVSPDRIRRAYETAKVALLAEMIRVPVAADDPVQKLLDEPVSEMRHWVGELSTSALSTATAVMALEQMRRQYVSAGRDVPESWTRLIRGGIEWLIAHQNADGGWGDTVKSISNISTTMLCHAVLHATQGRGARGEGREEGLLSSPLAPRPSSLAQAYIDRAGGVPAVIARYGKDRTFSVPILTHCALAGLVDWDEVISLPFELACIPARFYAAVQLPVVSYALPALIAIGQVRFHFRPSRNPLRRWLQRWAKPASLQVLERIQPPNGGFLEATPLTSFVTMSLAAMGLIDHPVTVRGIEFIVASARWDVGWDSVPTASRNECDAGPQDDSMEGGSGRSPNLRICSWPIDTNLATWVTTLSINALGDDVPLDARPGLRAWLLRQQYRVVHPYTNAAPGGWAWTDLPGGVPDADDTPGAVLAFHKLCPNGVKYWNEPNAPKEKLDEWEPEGELLLRVEGLTWLRGLQNSDGGWPTFCRGWGTLPFDRSSPDITAHVIRAIEAERQLGIMVSCGPHTQANLRRRIKRGIKFLKRTQRPDGSWLPLWFGNQHAPNDENPTYGTAKVLAAFQALGRMSDESAVRGARWLIENQNPDGGWGAGLGTPSSVEDTALAVEALVGSGEWEVGSEVRVNKPNLPTPHSPLLTPIQAGLSWLIPRVEDGRFREPSPIGFYFAKLWYFEALYPVIFTVAALRKAAAVCENEQ